MIGILHLVQHALLSERTKAEVDAVDLKCINLIQTSTCGLR